MMAKKELTSKAIIDIVIGVMKEAPPERQYEAIADELAKFGVKSVKDIENAAELANNPLVPPSAVAKIAPLFLNKLRQAEEKAAASEQKKAEDANQKRLADILGKLKAVLGAYTGGTDKGFYKSVAKAALDAGVKDEAELRQVMELGSDIETFSLFSEEFVEEFNILKDSKEVAIQETAKPGVLGTRAKGLNPQLLEAARKAEAEKKAKIERLRKKITFLGTEERGETVLKESGPAGLAKLNTEMQQLKAQYLALTGKTGAPAKAKGKA